MLSRSEITTFYRACSRCRACDGAAYQAPPCLYAGRLDSDYLVIAQNPGEIKAGDTKRGLTAIEAFDKTPEELKRWYDWDFGTSHAQRQLAKVFGERWLSDVTYTNAIRCRTLGNAAPSKEMVVACSLWTSLLQHEKKVLVFVGRLAAVATLGTVGSRLAPFEPVKWKQQYIAYLPHYASWRGADAIKQGITMFETLERKAELG